MKTSGLPANQDWFALMLSPRRIWAWDPGDGIVLGEGDGGVSSSFSDSFSSSFFFEDVVLKNSTVIGVVDVEFG